MLQAINFLFRAQRRPATSSNSRSLPLPDGQALPQFRHLYKEEAFGQQELSDTAASFVSNYTGRHFQNCLSVIGSPAWDGGGQSSTLLV